MDSQMTQVSIKSQQQQTYLDKEHCFLKTQNLGKLQYSVWERQLILQVSIPSYRQHKENK